MPESVEVRTSKRTLSEVSDLISIQQESAHLESRNQAALRMLGDFICSGPAGFAAC